MSIYRVRKNRHRFHPISLGFSFSNEISKQVIFDESCKYDLGNVNQYDINKLFGVGFLPHHHYNSVRWGWRWSNVKQKVELFGYVYSQGKRSERFIGDVRIYESVQLSIVITGDGYLFVLKAGQEKTSIIFMEGSSTIVGYKLGAYFGGDEKAPHDMKILMNNIK